MVVKMVVMDESTDGITISFKNPEAFKKISERTKRELYDNKIELRAIKGVSSK